MKWDVAVALLVLALVAWVASCLTSITPDTIHQEPTPTPHLWGSTP